MRFYRIFVVTICFLMLPLFVWADEPQRLSLSAECAVLMEAESGEVYYSKNSSAVQGMASTTKIMTALVALESTDISKTVYVSKDAAGVIGSSIYLRPGDRVTMESLLYAMLLESANDAAAAIAIDVAQSVEAFAALMNAKAADLGLNDTNFTNPHGLYDDRHYTSAESLAVIAAHAMKNDVFRKIVSTGKHTITITGENTESRLLFNHNKMLRIYDGAIGIKTGYTIKSGRCLVSAAERNGLTLIAVTLNAPDDWHDHITMLNYGFGSYKRVELSAGNGINGINSINGINGIDGKSEENFRLPVTGGETDYVYCKTGEDNSVVLKKSEINITSSTLLKRFYYAPIAKDEVLGHIIYYNNGQEIARIPVTARYPVNAAKWEFNLFSFITGLFERP